MSNNPCKKTGANVLIHSGGWYHGDLYRVANAWYLRYVGGRRHEDYPKEFDATFHDDEAAYSDYLEVGNTILIDAKYVSTEGDLS